MLLTIPYQTYITNNTNTHTYNTKYLICFFQYYYHYCYIKTLTLTYIDIQYITLFTNKLLQQQSLAYIGKSHYHGFSLVYFSSYMASFRNVLFLVYLLFFFLFCLFVFCLFLFLFFFFFYKVQESEGTKKDRKLENLSILGSTSFILQDHM